MAATGKTMSGLVKIAGLLLGMIVLAACSPTYTNHGFVPTDDDVEEIMVGVDTRETVAAIVGRPGAEGLLTQDAWYYVQSEFKHNGFYAPEEIDREVLRISFTENDLVENIERFGLERGEVVVLSRRVTTSNTSNLSFLRQLFGGIGSLNLSEAFGG